MHFFVPNKKLLISIWIWLISDWLLNDLTNPLQNAFLRLNQKNLIFYLDLIAVKIKQNSRDFASIYTLIMLIEHFTLPKQKNLGRISRAYARRARVTSFLDDVWNLDTHISLSLFSFYKLMFSTALQKLTHSVNSSILFYHFYRVKLSWNLFKYTNTLWWYKDAPKHIILIKLINYHH